MEENLNLTSQVAPTNEAALNGAVSTEVPSQEKQQAPVEAQTAVEKPVVTQAGEAGNAIQPSNEDVPDTDLTEPPSAEEKEWTNRFGWTFYNGGRNTFRRKALLDAINEAASKDPTLLKDKKQQKAEVKAYVDKVFDFSNCKDPEEIRRIALEDDIDHLKEIEAFLRTDEDTTILRGKMIFDAIIHDPKNAAEIYKKPKTLHALAEIDDKLVEGKFRTKKALYDAALDAYNTSLNGPQYSFIENTIRKSWNTSGQFLFGLVNALGVAYASKYEQNKAKYIGDLINAKIKKGEVTDPSIGTVDSNKDNITYTSFNNKDTVTIGLVKDFRSNGDAGEGHVIQLKLTSEELERVKKNIEENDKESRAIIKTLRAWQGGMLANTEQHDGVAGYFEDVIATLSQYLTVAGLDALGLGSMATMATSILGNDMEKGLANGRSFHDAFEMSAFDTAVQTPFENLSFKGMLNTGRLMPKLFGVSGFDLSFKAQVGLDMLKNSLREMTTEVIQNFPESIANRFLSDINMTRADAFKLKGNKGDNIVERYLDELKKGVDENLPVLCASLFFSVRPVALNWQAIKYNYDIQQVFWRFGEAYEKAKEEGSSEALIDKPLEKFISDNNITPNIDPVDLVKLCAREMIQGKSESVLGKLSRYAEKVITGTESETHQQEILKELKSVLKMDFNELSEAYPEAVKAAADVAAKAGYNGDFINDAKNDRPIVFNPKEFVRAHFSDVLEGNEYGDFFLQGIRYGENGLSLFELQDRFTDIPKDKYNDTLYEFFQTSQASSVFQNFWREKLTDFTEAEAKVVARWFALQTMRNARTKNMSQAEILEAYRNTTISKENYITYNILHQKSIVQKAAIKKLLPSATDADIARYKSRIADIQAKKDVSFFEAMAEIPELNKDLVKYKDKHGNITPYYYKLDKNKEGQAVVEADGHIKLQNSAEAANYEIQNDPTAFELPFQAFVDQSSLISGEDYNSTLEAYKEKATQEGGDATSPDVKKSLDRDLLSKGIKGFVNADGSVEILVPSAMMQLEDGQNTFFSVEGNAPLTDIEMDAWKQFAHEEGIPINEETGEIPFAKETVIGEDGKKTTKTKHGEDGNIIILNPDGTVFDPKNLKNIDITDVRGLCSISGKGNSKRYIRQFLDCQSHMPSAEALAACALYGIPKMGWYENSALALKKYFPTDSDRFKFVMLLAANSPQCSVHDDFVNSIAQWRAYKQWKAEHPEEGAKPSRKEWALIAMNALPVNSEKIPQPLIDTFKTLNYDETNGFSNGANDTGFVTERNEKVTITKNGINFILDHALKEEGTNKKFVYIKGKKKYVSADMSNATALSALVETYIAEYDKLYEDGKSAKTGKQVFNDNYINLETGRTANRYYDLSKSASEEGYKAVEKAKDEQGNPFPLGSLLEGWFNNEYSIWTEDPKSIDDMPLSGAKVNAFWANLVENYRKGTLDTHMAAVFGVMQEWFGGKSVTLELDDGKKVSKVSKTVRNAPYVSYEVGLRRAANVLNADENLKRPDGKPWTVANVQEMTWALQLAIDNLANAKVLPKDSKEYAELDALGRELNDNYNGHTHTEIFNALRKDTDTLIKLIQRDSKDFFDLFNEEESVREDMIKICLLNDKTKTREQAEAELNKIHDDLLSKKTQVDSKKYYNYAENTSWVKDNVMDVVERMQTFRNNAKGLSKDISGALESLRKGQVSKIPLKEIKKGRPDTFVVYTPDLYDVSEFSADTYELNGYEFPTVTVSKDTQKLGKDETSYKKKKKELIEKGIPENEIFVDEKESNCVITIQKGEDEKPSIFKKKLETKKKQLAKVLDKTVEEIEKTEYGSKLNYVEGQDTYTIEVPVKTKVVRYLPSHSAFYRKRSKLAETLGIPEDKLPVEYDKEQGTFTLHTPKKSSTYEEIKHIKDKNNLQSGVASVMGMLESETGTNLSNKNFLIIPENTVIREKLGNNGFESSGYIEFIDGGSSFYDVAKEFNKSYVRKDNEVPFESDSGKHTEKDRTFISATANTTDSCLSISRDGEITRCFYNEKNGYATFLLAISANAHKFDCTNKDMGKIASECGYRLVSKYEAEDGVHYCFAYDKNAFDLDFDSLDGEIKFSDSESTARNIMVEKASEFNNAEFRYQVDPHKPTMYPNNVLNIYTANPSVKNTYFSRANQINGVFVAHHGSHADIKVNECADKVRRAGSVPVLLHEGMHMQIWQMVSYLEKAVPSKMNEQELIHYNEVKSDFDRFCKDAGIPGGFDEVTKNADSMRNLQEYAAAQFERYVYDGVPSDPALDGLFAETRKSMYAAYGKLKGAQAISDASIEQNGFAIGETSPVAKQFFDKMMAIDRYADQLLNKSNARNLRNVADTELMKKGFNKLKPEDERRLNMLRAEVARRLRDTEKVWKQIEGDVRKAIIDEMKNTPEYKVREFLRSNTISSGSVEAFDKTFIDKIPPQYMSTNGASVQELMEYADINSTEELLKAIVNSDSVDDAINIKVDTAYSKLLGEHGLNKENMEKLAKNYFSTKETVQEVVDARDAINEANGISTNGETADNAVSKANYDAENSSAPLVLYSRSKTTNAEKVSAALDNNEPEKASELLNEAVKTEAKNVATNNVANGIRRNINSANAVNEAVKTSEFSKDPMSACIAGKILNKFGYDNPLENDKNSLESLIRDFEEGGDKVEIAPWILQCDDDLDFKELSYSQQRDVLDAIENVEYISHRKGVMFSGKRASEVISTATDNICQLYGIDKNKVGEYVPDVTSKNVLWVREKARNIKGYLGLDTTPLRKVEYICNSLDGYTDIGYFHQNLFQPARDAYVQNEDMKRYFSQKIENLLVNSNIGNTEDVVNRNGVALKRDECLAIALNCGTYENREHLAVNHSNETINAVLENLTPEEVAFVKGVWNIWDEVTNGVNDGNVHYSGSDVVKAEMTGNTKKGYHSIQVKLGGETVEGKPYPIVLNDKVTAKTGRFDQSQVQGEAGFTPSTRKVQGLKLSISEFSRKMFDGIGNACWAKTLRDIGMILADDKLHLTMNTAIGEENVDQIYSWYRDMKDGTGKPSKITNLERNLTRLVPGTTMAILGLNPWVAALQAGSAFQVAAETRYGPVDGIAAATEYFLATFGQNIPLVNKNSYFQEKRDRAMRLSGLIRNRGNSYDRDVQDLIKSLSYNGMESKNWLQKAYEKGEKLFGSLMSYVDLNTCIAVWDKCYNDKCHELEKQGLSPEECSETAVKYADSILAKTQPTSTIVDASAGMRNRSEVMKALTMFMTAFNNVYNVCDEAARARHINPSGQLGDHKKWHMANALFTAILAPVLYSTLVQYGRRGKLPDDLKELGKDFGMNTISYAANMTPASRLFWAGTQLGLSGFRQGTTVPVSPIFDWRNYITVLGYVFDDTPFSEMWDPRTAKGRVFYKSLAGLVGTYTGLPTNEVSKVASSAIDLSNQDFYLKALLDKAPTQTMKLPIASQVVNNEFKKYEAMQKAFSEYGIDVKDKFPVDTKGINADLEKWGVEKKLYPVARMVAALWDMKGEMPRTRPSRVEVEKVPSTIPPQPPVGNNKKELAAYNKKLEAYNKQKALLKEYKAKKVEAEAELKKDGKIKSDTKPAEKRKLIKQYMHDNFKLENGLSVDTNNFWASIPSELFAELKKYRTRNGLNDGFFKILVRSI